MIAKIEIYNDNGNIVGKYEMSPSDECIEHFKVCEIHKYKFNFAFVEWREKYEKET